MIKKKIALMLATISCIAVFAGCSSDNKTAGNASTTTASDSAVKEVKPQGEKEIKKQADMMGKVKSIVGNEVTIDLVQMPERPEISEEEMQKRKEEMKSGGGTQARGAGGDGMKAQSTGEDLKLTGESETFIIPVGVPITSNKRGNQGMEKTELELGEIYEGMVLQVWLKEGNDGAEKIAEGVSVSTMK